MAKDPYKYFRIEGRELLEGLSQGILELEKGAAGSDLVGRLLRQAHTLKGAARVVHQGTIAELSHAIEDALSPYRDVSAPIPHERVNDLLRLLDAIGAHLKSLEPSAQAPAELTGATPAAEEPVETVRVEIGEMDALLHEAGEASIHLSALRQEAAAVELILQMATALPGQIAPRNGRARMAGAGTSKALATAEELRVSVQGLGRRLSVLLDRAQGDLAKVQARAEELRLLPASSLFATLERAARDAAESLGKRVEFQASGGEHRLDAHVLRSLRDALVHVVRNAVAHGIEPEGQRQAAGKPPAGQVTLRVERNGGRIAFICEDDGRGIDIERVRRVAVERGLVPAGEAATLAMEDAQRLVFHEGFSTSGSVTQVAGRGIGLDVVRETAARLKGQASIHSQAMRGTTVRIRVPVSLESLEVLEVEAAGLLVSLPFDAVRKAVRVNDTDVARSAEGESILHDGKAVPFRPLARLLRPRLAARPATASAIILEDATALAAVGVDRLVRKTTVVMRPLPSLVGPLPLITGASLDGNGDPQPVLDAAALVEAVRSRQQPAAKPHAPARPMVLVIDDSLTTRMLEQSILETAGYHVDLAASGEEAMHKARQRPYALFVVDVEMPGMDGFEFIERVAANRELRGVPSILVTSRASADDRLRGEKVGAKAYIVKSEFDEGELLRTIRMLVG